MYVLVFGWFHFLELPIMRNQYPSPAGHRCINFSTPVTYMTYIITKPLIETLEWQR